MRVKSLRNTSNDSLEVVQEGGIRTILPPGAELKNVRVENMSEVRGKAATTVDLGEIDESRPRGKTKIFG